MWKRGFPCRCPKCGARRTTRHKPESYWGSSARFAWCPQGCFRYDSGDRVRVVVRVDVYRLRKEHKRNNCSCDGYPFQHRRRSLHCAKGGRLGGVMRFYDAVACEDAYTEKQRLQEEFWSKQASKQASKQVL